MNKGVNNEPNNHQDVQIHQKGIKYHVRTWTAEICQLNMAFSGVSRALFKHLRWKFLRKQLLAFSSVKFYSIFRKIFIQLN